MNRLAGKYALITGASRGLGRQLAIDFAREGAAGLALVARDAGALHETRERVRETMRAWRASYGAAPSSYDWRTHARTPARRRSAQTTTDRRMARAVHCDRSVGSWAAAVADALGGA